MKKSNAYLLSLATAFGCAGQTANLQTTVAQAAGTSTPIVVQCEEFTNAAQKNTNVMSTGSVVMNSNTVRVMTGGEFADGSNRTCTVASQKEMEVTCTLNISGADKVYVAAEKTEEQIFNGKAQKVTVTGLSLVDHKYGTPTPVSFTTKEFSMNAGTKGVFGVSPDQPPFIGYKAANGETVKAGYPPSYVTCTFK